MPARLERQLTSIANRDVDDARRVSGVKAGRLACGICGRRGWSCCFDAACCPTPNVLAAGCGAAIRTLSVAGRVDIRPRRSDRDRRVSRVPRVCSSPRTTSMGADRVRGRQRRRRVTLIERPLQAIAVGAADYEANAATSGEHRGNVNEDGDDGWNHPGSQGRGEKDGAECSATHPYKTVQRSE
jgi:hypothetical protein